MEQNRTEQLRKLGNVLFLPRNPMEFLQEGQYKSVPPGITRVVAVLCNKHHYAVLEVDITNKKVLIYDGLYRDLNRSAMKHCMLCDLRVVHLGG